MFFNGCIFYIENIYGCNGPNILKKKYLHRSINVYLSIIQYMYFDNFNCLFFHSSFHQKEKIFSSLLSFVFLYWSDCLKL